jgi:glycine/D-amino acid oxidase-like deaminating enzyme
LVTKPRDLRTGRPIWPGRPAAAFPIRKLTRDIDTDVLIIGAGITGAMIADNLVEAGRKVVMVDRRPPGSGSTSASTALVQYEVDTPLSVLVRKIGRDPAIRAWRRSRLAVEAVAARLHELSVPDVVRRDSLYLAGDELDAEGLAREFRARRMAGLSDSLLSRKQLKERFGIARSAGLLGYGNLAIDPRKTTLALLANATEKGARVYSPVTIAHVDCKPRSATATTATGHTIACRHLIFATGYEWPTDIPAGDHKIVSTYAIATVKQKAKLWPEQCMIWEASETYLYLRTTPEGRIICGGEDEAFSDEARRDALLARKTKTLQRKLGRMLPEISTETDFAWTGSFGQTNTGLPTIGQVPKMRNCWAAFGYGGNGITYSRIAADVITGALCGYPDADAELYDFKANKT